MQTNGRPQKTALHGPTLAMAGLKTRHREAYPKRRPEGATGRALLGVGKSIGKIIGVFAVFDGDVHGAGEAGELARTGAGNNDDVE